MGKKKSYVRVDENGVYRVGETHVMLDSVVAAFRQGHSAETIQQEYPALDLETVYGSIAFYLGNATEVDGYLLRQNEVWATAQAKAEAAPSAVVERLRKHKMADAK